jgi:hypothetical protein
MSCFKIVLVPIIVVYLDLASMSNQCSKFSFFFFSSWVLCDKEPFNFFIKPLEEEPGLNPDFHSSILARDHAPLPKAAKTPTQFSSQT